MARTKQQIPQSMAEAVREKDESVDLMQEIQTQLGDKNRLRSDGARMSSDEFWAWHQAAKVKLRHVTSRVRFLKAWIRENDTQQQSEKQELKSALAEYALHLDDCLWWKESPCSCGLDGLLDKYNLARIERDEIEGSAEDTEDTCAA